MMRNFRPAIQVSQLVKYSILAFWLASQILQIRVGLADNGDWIRLANWVSSGPVGLSEGWVDQENPQYFQRYFTYWLPDWRLDYPMQGSVISSVFLLWLPGILFNTIFSSNEVLHLSWISLLPRLLALIFLLGMFNWLDRYIKRKTLFYLTLILPLALMTSTTDYVAYFNTFYQETAAFIGLLYLIWSLLAFGCHPSGKNLFFFLASLLIITFSKASAFYWPILTAPFIIIPARTFKTRWFYYLVIGLSVILLPVISLRAMSAPAMHRINMFDSFYTGILPFSNNPIEQLDDLSIGGTEDCIDNIDYYSAARSRCLAVFSERIDRKMLAMILIGEPTILFKQFIYGTSQLQKLGLRGSDYYAYNLGNYAPGESRPPGAELLNAWSTIKSYGFPKGWGVIFAILIFGFILGYNVRYSGWVSRLAWSGFMLLGALILEIMITLNGDGKYEVVKHLFLANMIFDLLLILAINMLLIRFVERPDILFARQDSLAPT